MIDYRGARGSSAGDDYHELWVARQAIRLLSDEDGLRAITVEGVRAKDEKGASRDAWDGVDCTLYFGDKDMKEPTRVELVQVKYSSAQPSRAWTVSRLIGPRRDRSVVGRLAKAWKSLVQQHSSLCVQIALVSNQPIHPEVESVVRRASQSLVTIPTKKPSAKAPGEVRMAFASGLTSDEFVRFASSLRFEGDEGSRLAIEGRMLRAIAEWTGPSIRQPEANFRHFIRRSMMPDTSGEIITHEDVRVRLVGASNDSDLFPCPTKIDRTERPVRRASIREAIRALKGGNQHVCLHGGAGTGKTTALQEIQAGLPIGSVMVVYDCYGNGRYLASSTLRHRPRDAFLQLTNELATRLRLPLFLTPEPQIDYPRLFAVRLLYAAKTLAAHDREALIVIAVDAADNAIAAGKSRDEQHFVRDFLLIRDQPPNVRFVVTSRTGRLDQLQLPNSYRRIEIAPFNRDETAEHVSKLPDVSDAWVDDFHHLSNGIPRVQVYALTAGDTAPVPHLVLDCLKPGGKLLEDIFRKQFEDAVEKAGSSLLVEKLCAGLIALPRPIPLPHLAAVVQEPVDLVADVCADLAPGLRLQDETVCLADEDMETFVDAEAKTALPAIRASAAERLLRCKDNDPYAALNVADVLVGANRREDLLDLVEREEAVVAISDAALRREAEAQRLGCAIRVCRTAGNVSRALRFVLMGAEGIKSQNALRRLLLENSDLAVRFAPETVSRLVLADGTSIEEHGRFLFHDLPVAADRGDAISYREGRRSVDAWLKARQSEVDSGPTQSRPLWRIDHSEVCSMVEAAIKLGGPVAGLRTGGAWRPRSIRYRIAATLSHRLIAQGHRDWGRAVLAGLRRDPATYLIVANTLALSGCPINVGRLIAMLKRINIRRRLGEHKRTRSDFTGDAALVLDAVLLTCEVLTARRAKADVIQDVLAAFLSWEFRRIDKLHCDDVFELDLLFRAYALHEVRGGRSVDTANVFLARTQSAKDGPEQRHEQERDSALSDVASAMLGVYAAVAAALAEQTPATEHLLDDASASLQPRQWRMSQRRSLSASRSVASRHVTTLLVAGHAPKIVMRSARAVHGSWASEGTTTNREVVARLSLRPELHGALLHDLSVGATKTQEMRISANEKCQRLLDYARLMLPLSADDASACFNRAIESSKELDREAISQIRVLDELVAANDTFVGQGRAIACNLAKTVDDAYVRLEGDEYFPWDEAMRTLARLDTSLALACTARWDVEGKARLRQLLPPLLQSGLANGSINPAQAVALALFVDVPESVLAKAVTKASQEGTTDLSAVGEEAARLAVVRGGRCRNMAVVVKEHQVDGHWARCLVRQERFIEALHTDAIANSTVGHDSKGSDSTLLANHDWDPDILVDSLRLQAAIESLIERTREAEEYIDKRSIFESARAAVPLKHRRKHLDAMAEIRNGWKGPDTFGAIILAVQEWSDSLAVKQWCRLRLPHVIVDHFDSAARYVPYETDHLNLALDIARVESVERCKLILRGVERHVERLGSEALFGACWHGGEVLERSRCRRPSHLVYRPARGSNRPKVY